MSIVKYHIFVSENELFISAIKIPKNIYHKNFTKNAPMHLSYVIFTMHVSLLLYLTITPGHTWTGYSDVTSYSTYLVVCTSAGVLPVCLCLPTELYIVVFCDLPVSVLTGGELLTVYCLPTGAEFLISPAPLTHLALPLLLVLARLLLPCPRTALS